MRRARCGLRHDLFHTSGMFASRISFARSSAASRCGQTLSSPSWSMNPSFCIVNSGCVCGPLRISCFPFRCNFS